MHQECDQRYFLIAAEIYKDRVKIRSVNANIMCPDGIFVPSKAREYIMNTIKANGTPCDCVVLTTVFELSSLEFFQDYKQKTKTNKVRLELKEGEGDIKKATNPNLKIIKSD